MTSALLALAVAAAAPAPRPAGVAARVEVHPASRGRPRLVLAPGTGERAALVVRFAAGAAHDGNRPGLTRVAQHALLEANARYPYDALARELYRADATIRLETGVAESAFVLETDRRDFDRLAGILLDLLLAPALDGRAYRQARERAIIEERSSTGRSDWVALIVPNVIDDGPWGNPPYGDLGSLERIGVPEVQAHLRGALSPANATVVAAGAFDARALKARIARYAGGVPAPLRPPEVTTPFSLMIPGRREVYLLAFRASYATPEATASALVAAALLEERVHRTFQERGVGYSEYVGPERHGPFDLFLLVLPAHDPGALPLSTLLEAEVALVRAGRFEEAELERNRAWALAELGRIARDPAALARRLAAGADAGWYGPLVAERVRTLDRGALERRFRELLAEDAAIRILYSPRASRRGPIPDTFLRSAR